MPIFGSIGDTGSTGTGSPTTQTTLGPGTSIAYADPINTPNAYDVIVLAGEDSPGLCTEVAGASNPSSWDEKKGTGMSGATLTYTGDGLAKFTVKLIFWLEEHFEAWDDFKLLLVNTPQGKQAPKALDIYHPYLESLPVPIRSVVVEETTQLTQTADGIWTVEIKFRQFRAPKPATGTPAGSKGGYTDAKQKDPADATIDNLVSQLNKLAA